ncbi:MAG: hypothetical protein H6660_04600 [Ardenticatenaceae bacterium]|nr:hypothetical protein [Ardenticatenaceae bacterium]
MPDNIPFFVPFKKNPHFVGRSDDLTRLHTALQGSRAVGIIPAGTSAAAGVNAAITGQGGVGKTQLAVRYAYDYASQYPDGVYWLTAAAELDKVFAQFGQDLWQILPYRQMQPDSSDLAILSRLVYTLFDAEEINTLCHELHVDHEYLTGQGLERTQNLVSYLQRQGRLAELTALVYQHRPKLVNRPQDELIRLAFTYLKENPHSLLILDNLPDPAALHEAVSRDWIPAELPGSLLFTTRRRTVHGCQAIELTVLPEPAALALLLRHPHRRPAQEPTHPDHQTAREICALLGRLPLALEIAGAHLGKQDRIPMAQYLAELRQRGAIGVLDDERLPVTPAVHERGIAAVLQSQWESLEHDEALLLLRAATLFPEAALIPVARLGLLTGVPEASASFFDVTLAQAMGDLDDASLVEELKAGQLRLHPLVREYAAEMTHDKTAFAHQCAQRVAEAYEDFPTLERHCAQRGIDAMQEDLLVALDLAAPASAAPDIPQRLQTLLRLLQREVHNLRGWQPQAQPTHFAQQIAYRAQDLKVFTLLEKAQSFFEKYKSHLATLQWAAKRESLVLEKTLIGHAALVRAVAVTPDGARAISASADRTLKVWNLQTGAELASITLDGSLECVAVAPDGVTIVTGDGAGNVYCLRYVP